MATLGELLPNFMHFDSVESANLILLLGTILFLGAIGGRLFQKLKIPQVVGYIVIGILIGQSGLQVLNADVVTTLTPLPGLGRGFWVVVSVVRVVCTMVSAVFFTVLGVLFILPAEEPAKTLTCPAETKRDNIRAIADFFIFSPHKYIQNNNPLYYNRNTSVFLLQYN